MFASRSRTLQALTVLLKAISRGLLCAGLLGVTEGRRLADVCLLQHLPHLAVIALSQSPHAKWSTDRKPPLSGEQRRTLFMSHTPCLDANDNVLLAART